MNGERSPEILRILQAQEMRGELLVNHIRLGFTLLNALMLANAWEVNTQAANRLFVVQLVAWFIYCLVLYAFFKLRPSKYAGWLKYVSIFVDLALLTLAAPAMARNHSGIVEFLTGFIPLVFVFLNMLSAFRHSVPACLYSAVLSAVFNGTVLAVAVETQIVPVSEVTVYGQNAINVIDQSVTVVFIALPAILAAAIARVSRGLILRAELESRERTRLEHEKQQLGRYLSADLVEFVLSEPGRLKLGGTRRHVSVMFTDIRNFTPLAESVEPEVVVSFLNEYFTVMVDIVFRHGGTLDKYIGDGLMAVFGAPFAVKDAPSRAVLAAIEMVHALEELNRSRRFGFGQIEMGVGIATGTVVSGNIGSLRRMEYTCIGDTVNTASRLEHVNKDVGSQIVICQATQAALGGAIPTRPAGVTVVRGKSREVSPFIVDVTKISEACLEELRRRIASSPPRLDSLPPRGSSESIPPLGQLPRLKPFDPS